MNKLVKWGIVAFIALIVLVVLPASSYNKLVRLSQGTDTAWAQVQNVYQRRADLIPNLVETVKGAANFEKSTLTEILRRGHRSGASRSIPTTPRRTPPS